MTKRPSLLALGWGAGWGIALGSWILAPRLLVFCNLHPASLAGWLALDAALCAVFALLGAAMSFFACFPVVLVEAVRGRVRQPELAYGLAAPILLPVVYLALALAVDVITRGPLRRTDHAQIDLVLLAPLATAAAIAVAAYRRPISPRRLAAIVALIPISGLSMLPPQAPPFVPAIAASATLLRREPHSAHPPAPLLFVGVDSANWRSLDPLLERGALPTLRRLRDAGLRGRVAAIWPPYWSAPAWAAITTGFGREQTGIYEDLTFEAPGFPPFEFPLRLDFALAPLIASAMLLAQTPLALLVAPRRPLLRRAPFWELLSQAGVKSAVVRMPFTFPAEGGVDYVISDRVGEELWELLGTRPDTGEQAVWPPTEARAMLAPFAEPLSAPEFADILAEMKRLRSSDGMVNPFVVLERAAKLDEQTSKAAVDLLRRHPDVAMTAVYFGGFDLACHAFWEYRFPEDYVGDPPGREELASFREVIDRYWRFLDRSLGEIVAAFPREPNVVIVADHGAERNTGNYLWRSWHSANGAIFIAAGPDVPQQEEELRVSYFDVTPTVLDLAGFEKPVELPGASLMGSTRAKTTASESW